MIAFQIGDDDSGFVRVSVNSVSKHEIFSASVEVVSGPFRGRFPAHFESHSLSEFHKQLAILNETVSGSAVLTSREQMLELTLECDAMGHIFLRGEARDTFRTGTRLLFNIGIDQTHIPKILSGLKSTLESI